MIQCSRSMAIMNNNGDSRSPSLKPVACLISFVGWPLIRIFDDDVPRRAAIQSLHLVLNPRVSRTSNRKLQFIESKAFEMSSFMNRAVFFPFCGEARSLFVRNRSFHVCISFWGKCFEHLRPVSSCVALVYLLRSLWWFWRRYWIGLWAYNPTENLRPIFSEVVQCSLHWLGSTLKFYCCKNTWSLVPNLL